MTWRFCDPVRVDGNVYLSNLAGPLVLCDSVTARNGDYRLRFVVLCDDTSPPRQSRSSPLSRWWTCVIGIVGDHPAILNASAEAVGADTDRITGVRDLQVVANPIQIAMRWMKADHRIGVRGRC